MAEEVTRAMMFSAFTQAAAWCGWPESEQQEYRAEIGALFRVIEQGESDEARAALQGWLDWLVDLSGREVFAPRCRALEASVIQARGASR